MSISLSELRAMIAGLTSVQRLRMAADLIQHGGETELSQAEVILLSVVTDMEAARVRR